MSDAHVENVTYKTSPRMKNAAIAMIVIGAITFLWQYFQEAGELRAFANVLVSHFYLLTLALGGAFWIALQYVAGAGWSVVVRRIPEAMTKALPITIVTTIVVVLGMSYLYSWSLPRHPSEAAHEEGGAATEGGSSPLMVSPVYSAPAHKSEAHEKTGSAEGEESADELRAADEILDSKSWWLSKNFFYVRMVLYLLIWIGLANLLVKNSRKQDMDKNVSHTKANLKVSSIFLPLFGLSFSAASVDFIMSVEPHWFSTIFGVYCFAGLFVSSLAMITMITILLKRRGYLTFVNEEHFQDLGKLMFGMSTFWAYIWFSQFMLIWYSNMPEEVGYYEVRFNGEYRFLFFLNVGVNWVLPFFALLPRPNKRNMNIMFATSAVILVGHWLDLYLMVFPAYYSAPVFGWTEIGIFLGAIGMFVLATFTYLGKANLVPSGDPYLQESLHHHQ
ncbi:MAG: hypothetical protein NUW37_08320 [Planctomycetes bacterium]|nr:hypothetical protein [Planctomycetota bacterium]